MIEKMTKYSFILLSGQTEKFLSDLQELGVMDITRSQKPVDAGSSELLDWLKECSGTISALKKINYSKDEDFKAIRKAAKEAAIPSDIVAYYRELKESLASTIGEIASVQAQISAREPWGAFDREKIAELSAHGYEIHFYKIPVKKYDPQWEQEHAIQIVSSDDRNIWFVVAANSAEEYSFPVAEIPAPQGNAMESRGMLAELERELIQTKGNMLKATEAIPQLEKEYAEKSSQLDLYLANAASESAAEDTISVFTGFAPVENDEALKKALDGMDVFYMAEKAVEEDNPPIKLRNNRFAKMFEVLTGMYGMPVYGEFDPTPVLAIFYLLFFGMCMGDAGYGLVLVIFGICVTKRWINIEMFKNIGPLISVLGAGTLIVGLILGTAFGVNLYEATWYPEVMKKFMIPDSVKIAGFSAQMVLAIGIGVFHICLAMITKAILYTVRFGIKKTISTWGWLILILGGIIVAAGAMTSLLSEAAVKWSVIGIGVVSALAIFIFNKPGRNPLKNIGSGLWDTYNMVTGLLGDVLSYIRLYALGLAGGMLGNAFNTLGMMTMGGSFEGATWQWVPFILILLFGHVLNLLMSCLGAFVHPLRLTFVEYFKNAGYEGKGQEYRPLKSK